MSGGPRGARRGRAGTGGLVCSAARPPGLVGGWPGGGFGPAGLAVPRSHLGRRPVLRPRLGWPWPWRAAGRRGARGRRRRVPRWSVRSPRSSPG